ncbi:Hpt domain-containing protein [Vibrio taketomensis]|uniref:Hpt domain-containing protein n=1 Tax=Vibrio taketomensis TaxID=2572923 RepID=UPI001389BE5D|nr:Hpt domain-containing protein [Vibrio taketomensis]
MLNFTTIKTILDDDNDVLFALLSTYIEDFGDVEQKLEALYQAEDWQALFILSHSLKGTLRVLEETDVSPVLEKIEHQSREGEAPELNDVKKALAELASIKSQIEHYLAAEMAG